MKKRSLALTLLSICAVAATFVFTAVNVMRSNNARQSVVSKENSDFPEIAVEYPKEIRQETNEPNEKNNSNVTKDVSIPLSSSDGKKTNEEMISKKNEKVEEVEKIEKEENIFSPVFGGKIINGFSDTALVFQATYGDYRTHLGVDIEAEEDTPVVSIRDGVVIKSEVDPEEGYVVEIEHNDGSVSVYKNLAEKNIPPIGTKIGAGETIGAVGTSGIFESHLNPHLHFEVLEDNVEVNPEKYLE